MGKTRIPGPPGSTKATNPPIVEVNVAAPNFLTSPLAIRVKAVAARPYKIPYSPGKWMDG